VSIDVLVAHIVRSIAEEADSIVCRLALMHNYFLLKFRCDLQCVRTCGGVACVTVDREKVMALQKKFRSLVVKDGHDPDTITRDSFDTALKATDIHPQDQELLARMFVLFDHTGSDSVNYKVRTSEACKGDHHLPPAAGHRCHLFVRLV
jgi:hypothetical protein